MQNYGNVLDFVVYFCDVFCFAFCIAFCIVFILHFVLHLYCFLNEMVAASDLRQSKSDDFTKQHATSDSKA